MKRSKLLFVAAISASLVGCQDDTFVSSNSMTNGGMNGKLVEAGLLGIGRDANADTRAYSVDGRFIWMPTGLGADGKITADPITGASRSNQRIGFCWTGINTEHPEYSSASSLTQKVYSNYEFEHVGWLDIEAKNGPVTEECPPYKLTNGAYMIGETGNGDVATWAANPYTSSNGTGTKYQTSDNGKNALGSYSGGDLNLGSGLFKTNNADVFEGEYLVYFPYTDKFTKGQILATQPDHFDVDVTKNRFETLSRYAFAVGHVKHYAGGQSLSQINAKTLSSFAGVKLYNSNTTFTTTKIKKVILYADESKFLFEQDLDASKCVDAIVNDKAFGANLYYDGKVDNPTELIQDDTNAIYATLSSGSTKFATITTAVNSTEATALRVYFPVLPQTIQNLKVILVADNDQTYEYSAGAKEFKSSADCSVSIDLKNATFTNKYMVVDEETLFSALANIKDNGSATSINTIQLLKDVKIEDVASHTPYVGTLNSLFFDKNINIMTNCGAGLFLAAGQNMNIKSLNADAKLTFNVNFTIEGAGCCGSKVARLAIGGTQANACKVDFNNKIVNNGALALANVFDQSTMININELENAYDEWAIDGSKMTDAAALFFLGNKSSVINISTLTNKGTIVAKPSSVEVTDNNTTFTDKVSTSGYTVTGRPINVTIGTLTNEVSLCKHQGLTAGGTIEIEKNTLINVTTKLENKSDAALIKIIGTSASATDGRLDVKGTSINAGTIDNTGVVNFTASSLDNNGLFIDQTSGQVGGKMIDNGKGAVSGKTTKYYAGDTNKYYATDLGYAGIYVSQVATVGRMAFVLDDAVEYPSTVIVEILGCDENFFNLAEYTNDLSGKDVYVKATQQIAFKSYSGSPIVLAEKSFGHCVEVFSGAKLVAKDGILSTVKNVIVNENATFIASESTNGYPATTVTIGENLINYGATTHRSALLKAKNIMNEETGAFTSKSTFEVTNDILTSGNFVSEGTNNKTLNFKETDGLTTFAAKTTTTVSGRFDCTGGQFERLGLDGGSTYRATVNVGTLGATDGTTSTAWPTEM